MSSIIEKIFFADYHYQWLIWTLKCAIVLKCVLTSSKCGTVQVHYDGFVRYFTFKEKNDIKIDAQKWPETFATT